MSDMVMVAANDIRLVGGVWDAITPSMGHLRIFPGMDEAFQAMARLKAASDGTGMPEDPVSGLPEGAIHLNEMMRSFMEQDFDRTEAFALVLTFAQAAATGQALRGGISG